MILEVVDLKIGDKGINSMRHTSLLFGAKRNILLSRDALASNAGKFYTPISNLHMYN